MKTSSLLFGALAALLLIAPAHLNAQEQDGQIRAFLVRGDVQITNAAGKTTQLRRGQTFGPGARIVAGPDSSALLILSNGSTVNVTESTEMAIPTFKQEPFDKTQASFLTLKGDPSTSNTVVRLDDGTVAGEVKQIRPTSSFRIVTPVGSAGIRGTGYTCTYNASTGEASFGIDSGSADWTPIGGEPIEVDVGSSVRTTSDTAGGPPQTVVENLPEQARERINRSRNDTETVEDVADTEVVEIDVGETETTEEVTETETTTETETETTTETETVTETVEVEVEAPATTPPGTTEPGTPPPAVDQPPLTNTYSTSISPDGSVVVKRSGGSGPQTINLPAGTISAALIQELFNLPSQTQIEVALDGTIRVISGSLSSANAKLLISQLGQAIQKATGTNPFSDTGNTIEIVNPSVISPAGG